MTVRRCNTCGKQYPESFLTSTCRLCGGQIDYGKETLLPEDFLLEQEWYAWRESMLSAPPRPLNTKAWIRACAEFNGCAICGFETISEKLLVVPPLYGGRLYTYNVLPACRSCYKAITRAQKINPLAPIQKLENKDTVNHIFNYLRAMMIGDDLEHFDYDHDSIEIIVTVSETTSTKPFDGIYAHRIDEAPKHLQLDIKPPSVRFEKTEDSDGVTWRLLDE